MPAPEAALRLLGLAARAGALVAGTERVREAVRAGRAAYVVVAADASANSRGKLLPLLTARGVPHAVALDRHALGSAVGRGPLSAIGLTDASFAGRVRELLQAAGRTESCSRG
ncbi:MAG: ribosomal L7Ae/L30e/S12e/Gadd45 family protein [Gemmatimonadetes bacterium]|nr:ribosomal L7Ae/L30e/S12e/Gadd45 family protein [Gemmatimonadota bacterium]